MGYLNVNGEYVDEEYTGLAALLGRAAMQDTDPNFAETVAGSLGAPVIYGLTWNEIWQELWDALKNAENWKEVAQGAGTYPADIYWFGYGSAAMLRALGDLQYERVSATLNKTRELLTFAIEEFGEVTLELAPVAARGAGDAVVATSRAVSGVNHKTLKLTFMANVFANYMIHGGALSMIGRWAGGTATRFLAALVGSRLSGVPITQIYSYPWFNKGFFIVTKVGSIIRKGEHEHDASGDVENMQLIEVLVTLVTGKDDPEEIRNFLNGIQGSYSDQIRMLLWDLQGEEFANRVNERRTQLTVLVEELRAIESRFLYRQGDFYDNLIRAHNTCIRLRRAGFEHDIIDRIVELGDPTFTSFMRSYIFSLHEVLANILVMPEQADWWNYAMREEISNWHNNINNPDYSLAADGT